MHIVYWLKNMSTGDTVLTNVQLWKHAYGFNCAMFLQQFRPGYTSPQQLFHYGSIPMNFRYSSL